MKIPTRADIAAAAKALPEDVALVALAIGYRAGLEPFCSDQWLDEISGAIWQGARIGVDAREQGEAA